MKFIASAPNTQLFQAWNTGSLCDNWWFKNYNHHGNKAIFWGNGCFLWAIEMNRQYLSFLCSWRGLHHHITNSDISAHGDLTDCDGAHREWYRKWTPWEFYCDAVSATWLNGSDAGCQHCYCCYHRWWSWVKYTIRMCMLYTIVEVNVLYMQSAVGRDP